tara:strand:+ start:216 stop:386 length:171 start_codon:yes stop_codon:yes gene_type:complete
MNKKEYLSIIKTYLEDVGLNSQYMLTPYKKMTNEQLHAVVGLVYLVKTETLFKGGK